LTSKSHVARAARTIRAGGIVAYPTEAVFGLGCLPDDLPAVRRIIAIKGRVPTKGLLLIAADYAQLEAVAYLPEGSLRAEIEASWPGPVTWILRARPGVSALVTGGRDSVGVRLTAHPVARALCERVGSALISTSANSSGHPPCRRIWQVRQRLGRHVDYVLPGALGGLAKPTMIRDGRDGRILRPA
jgi:L-threonylcarbamoyladenylate synthase